MILAPSFHPQSALSEDSYRPAKDLESFNSLLPPPIEFIEGSSSSSLAVAQGKYEPINATPKNSKFQSSSAPSTPTPAPKAPKTPKLPSLHSSDIDISWPKNISIGSGLYNNGNTCFLNSALQCLLHTPPLLQVLITHKPDSCKARSSHPFCMTCSLREVAVKSHQGTVRAHNPYQITTKLQAIAKHMRKGRQEDSHEFLRYAVDALQKSCLAGLPLKIDPKLAETTWVHKIFGGRLRSRVSCHNCGHHSDTFDSILDLSIDIHPSSVHSLKDALHRFVAPDYLKGADKYKCEKCQKHVNAEKKFTIHEAPMVLTIQLKRFSPLGHKISQNISYDEQLNIQSYMSKEQVQGNFNYSLYGVICHAGGGPHSGHYYAFVKSREKKWYEMNDESVTMVAREPTGLKNAYILFYLRNREKGQILKEVIGNEALSLTPMHKPGLKASMKMKKKRGRDDEDEDEDDEDRGVKVDKPFIGPLLPSPVRAHSPESPNKRQKTSDDREDHDPQATSVKKKIEALKVKGKVTEALSSLTGYHSDGDGDEDKDKDEAPKEESIKLSGITERATTPPPLKSYVPAPISPSTFFSKGKTKHKQQSSPYSNSPSTSWTSKQNRFDPYARLSGPKTYGKRFGKRVRGI